MTCKVCRSFAVQNRAARPDVPFQPEVDCSEEGVFVEANYRVINSPTLALPADPVEPPQLRR
jgi:hypothetical protein